MMRLLLHKLNLMSLRMKIFITYSLIMTAIILLSALIIGKVSSDILMIKALENSQKDISVAGEKLDLLLNRIEIESLYVALNHQYQSIVSEYDNRDEYQKFLYASNMTMILTNLLSIQSTIDSIFFYDKNDVVYADNGRQERGYSSAEQQKSLEGFKREPNTTKWVNFSAVNPREPYDSFSLLRKVYSYSGEFLGVLAFNISEKQINNLFESYRNANLEIIVLAEDNRIVSAADKQLIGENISGTDYSSVASGDERVSEMIQVKGKQHLIVTYFYPKMKWTIVGIIPQDFIIRDVRRLTGTIIQVGLASIVFAYFVINKATTLIIKPLNHIFHTINTASQGDYSIRSGINTPDELGVLSSKINMLIENTEELIASNKQAFEERRRLELIYLQMQMNPHFLYNSIETVCGMVEIDEKKTAIRTLNDISNFYRGVLSGGRDIITLGQEVEITIRYLKILKVRYIDLFDCDYDFPDEMLSQPMIKLILQPIVENAVNHGFVGGPKHRFIFISGRIERGIQIITIQDNGRGMTEAQLQDVWVRKNVMPYSQKGFGIQNTDKRIKLYFGESYGISLESEPGKGTKVAITLPAEEVSTGDVSSDHY